MILQCHAIITYRFFFILKEIWSTISMQCISYEVTQRSWRNFYDFWENIFDVINSQLVMAKDSFFVSISKRIFFLYAVISLSASISSCAWKIYFGRLGEALTHVIWYFLMISAWNNKFFIQCTFLVASKTLKCLDSSYLLLSHKGKFLFSAEQIQKMVQKNMCAFCNMCFYLNYSLLIC